MHTLLLHQEDEQQLLVNDGGALLRTNGKPDTRWKDRERMRLKRANESSQEREKRLAKSRERMRQRRAMIAAQKRGGGAMGNANHQQQQRVQVRDFNHGFLLRGRYKRLKVFETLKAKWVLLPFDLAFKYPILSEIA